MLLVRFGDCFPFCVCIRVCSYRDRLSVNTSVCVVCLSIDCCSCGSDTSVCVMCTRCRCTVPNACGGMLCRWTVSLTCCDVIVSIPFGWDMCVCVCVCVLLTEAPPRATLIPPTTWNLPTAALTRSILPFEMASRATLPDVSLFTPVP
jgi:hypothetical protein